MSSHGVPSIKNFARVVVAMDFQTSIRKVSTSLTRSSTKESSSINVYQIGHSLALRVPESQIGYWTSMIDLSLPTQSYSVMQKSEPASFMFFLLMPFFGLKDWPRPTHFVKSIHLLSCCFHHLAILVLQGNGSTKKVDLFATKMKLLFAPSNSTKSLKCRRSFLVTLLWSKCWSTISITCLPS